LIQSRRIQEGIFIQLGPDILHKLYNLARDPSLLI